jgi:hypothetical protein
MLSTLQLRRIAHLKPLPFLPPSQAKSPHLGRGTAAQGQTTLPTIVLPDHVPAHASPPQSVYDGVRL